jgi:hypothetical protein
MTSVTVIFNLPNNDYFPITIQNIAENNYARHGFHDQKWDQTVLETFEEYVREMELAEIIYEAKHIVRQDPSFSHINNDLLERDSLEVEVRYRD